MKKNHYFFYRSSPLAPSNIYFRSVNSPDSGCCPEGSLTLLLVSHWGGVSWGVLFSLGWWESSWRYTIETQAGDWHKVIFFTDLFLCEYHRMMNLVVRIATIIFYVTLNPPFIHFAFSRSCEYLDFFRKFPRIFIFFLLNGD